MKRLTIALLLMAGCGDNDEIRRYRAPKDDFAPAPMPPPPTPSGGRMLAAIVPHGDQTFFFKFVAQPAELDPHVAAFTDLVKAVRFDPQITWTLPPGWTQSEGSGIRLATIHVGPLEISVVALAGDGGGTLANINRWREQLGLPPLAEAELEKHVTRVGDAVITDIKPDAPTSGIAFDLPAGWTQNPAPGQGRLLEFQAGPDVLVTVTSLPGTAGGLAANINRWRGQVGLPPADAPETRDVGAFKVVDLFGADRAILGALAMRDTTSIFIKASGAPDPVRAQQAAFESFVASVRLGE